MSKPNIELPNIEGSGMKAYYVDKDGDIFFSSALTKKMMQEYKLNTVQVVLFHTIAEFLITNKNKEDGNAISLEYLSNATSMTKSTVYHNATTLEEKGLIRRWVPQNTNKRTTRYDFKVIV